MISFKGHTQYSDIVFGGKHLVAIYAGIANAAELIWEKIRCCFSKGYWINELPWLNDEPWIN